MDYSSSITPPSFSFKYDVFLSFSDEDTRYSFISHLYEALRDKQIEVYVDQLQKGEQISSDLLKIIEESKISVIIFSKNYAASRWHLEELVHILESNYNQIVIPVYYDIEPADVRRQTNTFAAAFKKHEERYDYSRVLRWRDAPPFADPFKKHEESYDYGRVQRWRDALTEAANLSGFDLRDFKSESELKRAIVKEILNKLNVMPLSSPENTHTVDIIEEDSGHKDEEAIQVPKITVELTFVASNLILEIPSAVFDQLSSVHKPQYVLLSMLMSLTTMLICVIELVYKGGVARVGWRWRNRIPWFYYPSPSDKPFGTVTDFIGLLCSFFSAFSQYPIMFSIFETSIILSKYLFGFSSLPFVYCVLHSQRNPLKNMLCFDGALMYNGGLFLPM